MKTIPLLVSILFTFSALAWNEPSYTVMCTAKSGEILREQFDSPGEGGFSVTYEVVGKNGKVLQSFELTSMFDAAGGSDKENVSVADCEKNMLALAKRVKELGCSKVNVDKKICASSFRERIKVKN